MKLKYRQVSNCGTYGGYQTHRKIGEEPCAPCKKALSEYMLDYRRRKGQTKTTLMPIDLKCPNCGHDVARDAA